MGLRKLVQSKVRLAFRLVGNLAISVTFSQTKGSFNFTNQQVDKQPTNTLVIKGIVQETKSKDKPVVSTTTRVKSVMFITEDIGDPNIYSEAILDDGKVWKIVPPFESNGYTTILHFSREL